MRLEALPTAGALPPPSRWVGAVLCRDVLGDGGRPALLKGHRLERADALVLEASGDRELHLLWPGEGDVDEDSAATRLAAVVAGEGVDVGRPVESQVRLSARWRGLLRVDAAVLGGMNAIPDITVFALPDGVPIDAGRAVAGVKVTPLAIEEGVLRGAEEHAAQGAYGGRVLTVRRFLPLTVAAVVRERLAGPARERFERSLRGKLAWFGGSAGQITYMAGDRAETCEALRRAAEGADLVLAVGVASTDPLDVTWQAVLDAGAREVRRGLPVHPGSSYWIVDLRGRPVIGVASCGMFSRRTALDLLLTRCFAGEPLDVDFLAGLGHGGLLGPQMAWRFPSYEERAGGEE
jgi:Probable molybdopterin binding domain